MPQILIHNRVQLFFRNRIRAGIHRARQQSFDFESVFFVVVGETQILVGGLYEFHKFGHFDIAAVVTVDEGDELV